MNLLLHNRRPIMCFQYTFIITCFVYEKHPAENQMTLIWPFNVVHGQMYGITWKAIYDLLYEFHTNFDGTMYRLWNTTCWKFCEHYLTFKGHRRSKVLMYSERLYMTLYMCFTERLVIACTVSEILAQIYY